MFIRTDIGKTFGVELIRSSEMNAALELWDNIGRNYKRVLQK